MNKLKLIVALYMLIQMVEETKLSFQSDGFRSQTALIPYFKTKKLSKVQVYEDRGLSTKKLLLVSDGVGGSEYPSGVFADILVSEVANNIYKNWNVLKAEKTPTDSSSTSSSKKADLKNFIGKAVSIYNTKLDALGINKGYATSATLVGAYIETIRDKDFYTIFQFGDSLAMVLRKDVNQDGVFMNPVVATEAQQVRFNQPFQVVSNGNPMSDGDMLLMEVQAELHDIVIVGSDGVFDNFSNPFLAIATNYLLYMIELYVNKFGNLDNFKPDDILKPLVDDFAGVVQPYESFYFLYLKIQKINRWKIKVSFDDDTYPYFYDESLYQELVKRLSVSLAGDNDENLTVKDIIKLRFYQEFEIDSENDKTGPSDSKDNSRSANPILPKDQEGNDKSLQPQQENQGLANNVPRSDQDINTKEPVQNTNTSEPAIQNSDANTPQNSSNGDILDEKIITDSVNFFAVHKCTTIDLFEENVDESLKPTYSSCIMKILNDLRFNMDIVAQKYKPSIVSTALVKGVRYLFDEYPNIFSPFSKSAIEIAGRRYIGSKGDDLCVSMSLVVEDADPSNFGDISSEISAIQDAASIELESYQIPLLQKQGAAQKLI